MAEELNVLGEIHIENITLVSSIGSKIDLKAIAGEVCLYEDIFSNTLSGHVMIEDANDLINSMPLTGEELLEIEMWTPTLTNKFKKVFYVYKLQNRTSKKRVQTYMLNFCSPELIYSTNSKVAKSFSGPISRTVLDIMKNPRYIVTDTQNSNFICEETKNSYTFIAPYWSPFETINWLSTRAVNKSGVPNFLFFESNQEFAFVSIDSLIKQTPQREYVFSDSDPNTAVGKDGLMEDKYKMVMSIDTPVTFDYLRNVSAGMYASRLYTLDMTTKSIDSKTFDYIRDFDKSSHLNQYPLKTTELAKKSLANIFHMEKNNYLYGSTKQDQGYSNYFLERNSLIEQLSAFKILIKVHGRTDIKAGQTITFTIPQMRQILGDEIQSPTSKSEYYSGKYLVTAIKHQINNNKHVMFMEIVSDSFVKKLLN